MRSSASIEDDRAQFAKRHGTLEVPRRERAERERKRPLLLVGSASNTWCSRLEKRLGRAVAMRRDKALTCARRRLGRGSD